MASTPVLFIGHSHTRRLSEFVNRQSKSSNGHRFTNFGVAETDVKCYGVGGAKIQDLLARRFTSKVEQFKPFMLVIMIGDNDAVHSSCVDELSAKLVATASYFHRALKVPKICVTQLLPRFSSTSSNDRYNEQAYKINLALKEQIKSIEYMSFLQYDFARFPTENVERNRTLRRYYIDGVHLSDAGYRKLFKTLRSVVIRARAQWKVVYSS